MTHRRNASLVEALTPDFQHRNEPNFALGQAISSMLAIPGLRGLWPMSAIDDSGNAFDQSGNSRTLTYNGNPVYGFNGLAPTIAMDGTGDYLSRADEAGLSITGTESYINSPGLTLGCWFYRNNAFLTDLISYWAMEEASGASRTDSHGSNNLTDNGTVTQVAGIISNGSGYNGTNYLSHADNASLSTGNIDFSISIWAYGDPLVDLGTIIAKKPSVGAGEYRLYYDEVVTDRFIFEVYDSGGSVIGTVQADNLGSPSDQTWYHFVCWHDATAGQIGIAVNNGTPDTATVSGGTVADTAAAFAIGDVSGGGGLKWQGRIDEGAFWKRLITSQEIGLLYNSGAGLGYSSFTGATFEADLIAKWNTTGNQRSYKLAIDSNANVAATISSNGTAETLETHTTTLLVEQWYFAALRFEPSTELAVFVDGVKTTNVAAIPASIFDSTATFEIGSSLAGTGDLLDGRVSLCWLSASWLSDTTINNLFQQTRRMYNR